MKSWNYMGALTYMKAAYSFLPHNSWTTGYDLSLGIHFELANTAYSNGAIDVAKLAIHQIDQEGKCPDDKMGAYNLLVTILHHLLLKITGYFTITQTTEAVYIVRAHPVIQTSYSVTLLII